MKKSITVFVIFIIVLSLLAFVSFKAVDMIREYLYPREFETFVIKYSQEFDVPEALIYSVILAESNFDPDAKSHVGAIGLMQLMPDTLDWLSRLLGETAPTGDIADPETNIKYGTYYLRHLMDRFDSWDTAIAAYNAGHGRVTNWLTDSRYSDDGVNLKNIPYEETRNYVNRINYNFEQYKKIYYNGDA